MALTIVDADVLNLADPVVSYQAGDWVVYLGIIQGNAPPGTLSTISLTSSGGGSMTVFNSSADSNYRYHTAYVQATASGSSTFSWTTSGNVGTYFARGAVVLRGASYIEPVTFGFTSQSPSESGSTFADTVTAGFAGAVNFIHGRVGVSADFSGNAGLSLASVTPSDLTADVLYNTTGPAANQFGIYVAGDVGANTSWTTTYNVTSPPFTPYATSRGIMQWVYGVIEEEINAYWGINATAM